MQRVGGQDRHRSRAGHAEADFLTRGAADPYAFLMPTDAAPLAAIGALPHVTAIGRRLNVGGLISFRDATMSFVGAGIEPAKEERVARNLRFTSGSNLDAASGDEIIVGQGLAANLGIETGSRVVLVSSTRSGGTNAVELVVRGIFTSQIQAFDEIAVRMPLPVAQKLLRVKASHVWVVSLDGAAATDAVADAIRALPATASFDVRRWIDLSDFYTKTVDFMSGQLGVMRVFIGLIVVLGVSNMLVMNVLERTGEIGTMLALGNRRSSVVRLFVVESAYSRTDRRRSGRGLCVARRAGDLGDRRPDAAAARLDRRLSGRDPRAAAHARDRIRHHGADHAARRPLPRPPRRRGWSSSMRCDTTDDRHDPHRTTADASLPSFARSAHGSAASSCGSPTATSRGSAGAPR